MFEVGLVADDDGGNVPELPEVVKLALYQTRMLEATPVGDTVNYQETIAPSYVAVSVRIVVLNL